MSVVFNHAIRHDLSDRNPIAFVRQSAKRRKAPEFLTVAEVQQLLAALGSRERTMVLLDVGTGLRLSELFGLQWKDVNFSTNEISVTRSVVLQVIGRCKTETSQKPIPLDPHLAQSLLTWRPQTPYTRADDWVFANPRVKGRKPLWGQRIMRSIIHPIAREDRNH